jgi:hypothetical protein
MIIMDILKSGSEIIYWNLKLVLWRHKLMCKTRMMSFVFCSRLIATQLWLLGYVLPAFFSLKVFAFMIVDTIIVHMLGVLCELLRLVVSQFQCMIGD